MISVNGEEINVAEFVDIMKYRAKGKKLSKETKVKIKILKALEYIEPKEEIIEEEIAENLDTEEQRNTPIEFNDDDFIENDDTVQGSLF